MTKSWETLKEKYPGLLEHIWPECGIGWYDLLDKLCADITECEAKEPILISEYEDEVLYCHANQVKEKYGGLRFYVSSATEEMYKIIDAAEKKSYSICDVCGESGSLRRGGWMMVRCDGCVK